jgi:hypothetical protein
MLARLNALTAAEKTYAELHSSTDQTRERMEALLKELGARDHNNLYLVDSAHEVRVLAGLLHRAVGDLLTAVDTCHFPE